jgi:hypothetical protein
VSRCWPHAAWTSGSPRDVPFVTVTFRNAESGPRVLPTVVCAEALQFAGHDGAANARQPISIAAALTTSTSATCVIRSRRRRVRPPPLASSSGAAREDSLMEQHDR